MRVREGRKKPISIYIVLPKVFIDMTHITFMLYMFPVKLTTDSIQMFCWGVLITSDLLCIINTQTLNRKSKTK